MSEENTPNKPTSLVDEFINIIKVATNKVNSFQTQCTDFSNGVRTHVEELRNLIDQLNECITVKNLRHNEYLQQQTEHKNCQQQQQNLLQQQNKLNLYMCCVHIRTI